MLPELAHLPEDEVVPDDALHVLVRPQVAVERLAPEVLLLLDVDQEPLALATRLGHRLKLPRHTEVPIRILTVAQSVF